MYVFYCDHWWFALLGGVVWLSFFNGMLDLWLCWVIILLVVGMRFNSTNRISIIFWSIGCCFGGQLCVVTLWWDFYHRKGWKIMWNHLGKTIKIPLDCRVLLWLPVSYNHNTM